MCVCAEPQFYRLEGVWLTESGMSLLRSISMSPLHKRRQRRNRLGALCGDVGPDGMELKEGDADDGKGTHTRWARLFVCLPPDSKVRGHVVEPRVGYVVCGLGGNVFWVCLGIVQALLKVGLLWLCASWQGCVKGMNAAGGFIVVPAISRQWG